VEYMAVYLNSGWYTVEISDANGCQQTDSVFVESHVGLADETLQSISFYPNPTSDFLHFSQQVDNIEILDLNGRTIRLIQKATMADVKSLSNGNYILKLSNKEGISIQQFVKE